LRSEWVNYWEIVDVRGTPRSDIAQFHRIPDGAIYQSTCASCHTSQLRFADTAQPGTAAFREGGINCEMCHGPSLQHVQRMKGELTTSGADNDLPLRFGKLPAEQSVAVCAQCHAQSAIHDVESSGGANYSEHSRDFYRTYSTHLPSDFSRS